MDSARLLGERDALHAMHAGLEPECVIGLLARDLERQLINRAHLPTLGRRIFLVHLLKLFCENGRFIAAGGCAQLQNDRQWLCGLFLLLRKDSLYLDEDFLLARANARGILVRHRHQFRVVAGGRVHLKQLACARLVLLREVRGLVVVLKFGRVVHCGHYTRERSEGAERPQKRALAKLPTCAWQRAA